jgi:hypothetical protein
LSEILYPFSSVGVNSYVSYFEIMKLAEDKSTDFSMLFRLCGLVVRVPGYRSRGPGLIPGATRFSEK